MENLIKELFINYNLIKESSNHFYYKSKTGPSKITKIPKLLNQELCILTGFIIGDGNIKKDKKRISIEISDQTLIKKLSQIFHLSLNIKPQIYKRIDKRPNRKIRYLLQVDNSCIYKLFTSILDIPIGKKSDIVFMPKIIKKSNILNKKAFLIEYLAADGGKRSNYIGFTTASLILRKDIIILLNELNIDYRKEKWKSEKYKKEYYGIYFKRTYLPYIMQGCRSGQTGRILSSFLEKIGGQA